MQYTIRQRVAPSGVTVNEGGFLMKKILFVATDAVPIIKSGGVAVVVGSVVNKFDKEHSDVKVMMHKWQCMKA